MVIFLKLQNEGSPVEITLLGNIFTFVIALPFFFLSIPNWSSVFALIILGIFQLGISYILYTTAIPHVSAIDAILIPILEPLLNPIWVFWATREMPGHHAFWGGIIVILAIITRGIYQSRKDRLSLHQS
jgi:drug/metabolite transporter (DMT)-like permease